MKRRQFLVGSAGLAGVLVPLLAQSATTSTPCPPPSVSVVGGTSATNACVPPAKGTAPSWFVNMPDRTWATPVTNTAASVGATSNAFTDWTGATVDTDRAMLVIPAQGGHASTGDNSVFAVQIKSESPAWKVLRGPSAQSGGDISSASWGDGRPRPVHGYGNITYAHNKIWMAPMAAVYNAEYSSSRIFAFDMTSLDWVTSYGYVPTSNISSGKEGTSAYDPVTDRIWGAYQYADAQGVWSIDPNTGVATAYNISLQGTGIGQYGMSAVVASKRAWVILGGNNAGAGLYVLNLDKPNAGPNEGGWYHPQITNPGAGPDLSGNSGPGFVWHAASGAFFCWFNNGANILKLKMNGDPFTGTYTWSTITPAAGNGATPGPAPVAGVNGRFNIIPDMGNGQSALVVVNDNNGPVYVYKVPAAGM